MITCILLSAGSSERFGSPKALAVLNGATVIEHVQNTLIQSPFDEIIVVLGDHELQIRPYIFNHNRIRIVYNKDHYFGQTSSVQAGWREVKSTSKGVMFLPVDCPLVQASSISLIIDHFKETDPDILIPTYKNKKGHPPIFNQRLRSKTLDLSREQGLNYLFTEFPPRTIEIDDAGIIKSFNTPEEFETINK